VGFRDRAPAPAARGNAQGRFSRKVLGGEIEPGDRVTVDVLEGDLHFDVERGGASEAEQVEEAVATS